jgi:mannonate dehydratase
MKLGLGLYRHMLTRENFQFARQAGATHIVAHLVDYFRGGMHGKHDDQPTGTDYGWGLAGDPNQLWTLEELQTLRRNVEAEGLVLEAIENFDPAHWHDILLDGPKRAQHIENVRTIIRRLGEAGILIMGYNFSIAGVAGRTKGNYARGNAVAVGMEGPYDLPMTNGMVWNMVYDPDAPAGTIPPPRTSSSGTACAVSSTTSCPSQSRPASASRCTRTTRRCRSSARSHGSSTSRTSTRSSST